MPSFAFDRSRHDRAGHLRTDDSWRDGVSRVLVLGGEHVATVDGPALRWLSPEQAPAGTGIYLGEQRGRHHAAVVVDRVPDELGPVSLRILAPQLGADELSLAMHAVAMSRWLTGSAFCPNCGAATGIRSGGHLRVCPDCGRRHFPRTDPAVIMLIVDDDDRALLGRQKTWPERRFSTLAGFVEPGESLEDAVRREIAEEVGLAVGEVRYAGSQPWPFPASLMVGFFGVATSTDIVIDDVEIAEAQWVSRAELAELTRTEQVLLPPPGVSISRWLIETWYGGEVVGDGSSLGLRPGSG